MAKSIKDAAGNIIGYEPGIIYDLGFYDPETNIRIPFYVGETTDANERLKAHTREGKNPKPDAEDKYHFIKQLNDRNLLWDMKELVAYEKDGPSDLEDEWVMKHLFDNFTLTNMVRGSDRWIKNMEDREKVSADMKQRGISSYKKYKEILTEEERERQRIEKHNEWKRKKAEFEQQEYLKARSKYLNDLYNTTYTSSLEACLKDCQYDFTEDTITHIRMIVAGNEKRARAHDRYMAQQERAREERRQLENELRERRAKQVKEETEKAERDARLKAEAAAKWEAERPEREARLKAESDALRAREEERLRELRERKEQERLQAEQDRINHQREIQEEADRIRTRWAEEGKPTWLSEMDNQLVLEQNYYEDIERERQTEKHTRMLARSADPRWQKLAVDLINAKKPIMKYSMNTTMADPLYIERQLEIQKIMRKDNLDYNID